MEEEEKIKIENHNTMNNCNVFTGPVYGGVFPLPGSQPVINNYYDKSAQAPKDSEKNGVASEKNVETSEERTQRKADVINAITNQFDFDEKSLCKDDCGQRITNERLISLFKHCLGIGSHPSVEHKIIIDKLWILLLDKRNQCFKNPNEDYFRQTVLNILGYFRERGVICGNKLDLTRCVFKKADDSLAKNIERGISSPVFPQKTGDMFDFYIDKLKEGEI